MSKDLTHRKGRARPPDPTAAHHSGPPSPLARLRRQPRPARRRRTGRALPVAAFISLAALLVTVFGAAAAAHGEVVDITVANRSGHQSATFAAGVGYDGAASTVEYIGDQNATYGAAGSGRFHPFVRIQGTGTERGYNTDGPLEFDTKSGTWTHSINLSEIPVVTENGGTYWELWADINETDSTKPISLDDMELWLTTDPNLTGYPFAGGADLIYDWSGHILVNDVNQGSGRGDLRYLVPFDPVAAEGCHYGATDCELHLILYSTWGGYETPGYGSDGGFEEWKVREYPMLQVSKTIEGSYQQDKTWAIDKADDAHHDLFSGHSVDHDYDITVTPTIGDPYDFHIEGVITIVGDDKTDLVAEVSDLFDGVPADIDCGSGSGAVTVPRRTIVTCTYELTPTEAITGTNTATATIEFEGRELVFMGSATIEAGDYAVTTNGFDEVMVTDDGGTPGIGDDDLTFGPFGEEATSSYSSTFTCPADLDVYTNGLYQIAVTNTAVIDQTGAQDTATVTVDCWTIDVFKSAETSYNVDYDWTIAKQVSLDGGQTWLDEGSVDVLNGTAVEALWRIAVDRSEGVELDHAVDGTITVENPSPLTATDIVVTDTLSDGQTPAVDCGDGTNMVTLLPGGSADCTYHADLASRGDLTNTGTATFDGRQFTWVADVSFTGVAPTVVTDATAVLTDPLLGLDTELEGDWTSATDELPLTLECGDTVNTATIDPSDSDPIDAQASVTVNCHEPGVSKTVETALTRTWKWDIVKTALDANGVPIPDGEGLTLAEGQTYDLDWEILVDLQEPGYVDSGWAVSGAITVTNPLAEPIEVMVGDTLILGGVEVPVVINCGDGPGDMTVTVPGATTGGDGEAVCGYSAAPSSGDAGSNLATVTYTAAGDDYTVDSAEVPVDFDSTGTDVTEIDRTVTVHDLATDPPTELGTVTPEQVPATFGWSTVLGPENLVCGMNEIVNTAIIVGDNDAQLAAASDAVPVDVTCGKSCTLTPGYWMTHNPEFRADHNGHGPPDDDAWELLGDVDGDGSVEGAGEMFPWGDTGKTYYEIMRTPSAGDPWYQLAFHTIAARLNVLNEADPSVVAATLDQAEAVLAANDPGVKGKAAKSLRAQVTPLVSVLSAWNEGLIGPGHCDESPI